MVVSLYIKTYLNWLESKYNDENITFDENLFYVPNNSAESMVEYLVKKSLVDRAGSVNDPVAYMGFNRGVINKDTTRGNEATRYNAVDEVASTRKMVKSGFILTTFIVTNNANLAEDIEEIYNVYVRETSVFPVDMATIFEIDSSDFRANVIHTDIEDTTPIDQKGNLWGLQFGATIMGPVFSLTQTERAKATQLVLSIYENNVLTKEITKSAS